MSLAPVPDAASLLNAERESLHKIWLPMLLLGILLILVGLAAMSCFYTTTVATILVIAILLMAGGAVEMINAFFARRWRGFWMHMFTGVLYAVLGFIMLNRPWDAAEVFTLMLAASFIIGGVFRIVIALMERFHGWLWVLVNGIVTLILGVMIWQRWPYSGTWVIGLFVGIEMLFAGWSWVLTALAVRGVAGKAS
jgi:uncharacterized membrane protein HdeD (DUF308 family)